MVDKLDWSDELADDIIGLDKLPKLPVDDRYCRARDGRGAAATGLAVGTPVTAGRSTPAARR